MTDLFYLSQTDGAGAWREKEAKDLTELVQRRITYLQVTILGKDYIGHLNIIIYYSKLLSI